MPKSEITRDAARVDHSCPVSPPRRSCRVRTWPFHRRADVSAGAGVAGVRMNLKVPNRSITLLTVLCRRSGGGGQVSAPAGGGQFAAIMGSSSSTAAFSNRSLKSPPSLPAARPSLLPPPYGQSRSRARGRRHNERAISNPAP